MVGEAEIQAALYKAICRILGIIETWEVEKPHLKPFGYLEVSTRREGAMVLRYHLSVDVGDGPFAYKGEFSALQLSQCRDADAIIDDDMQHAMTELKAYVRGAENIKP